MIDIGILDLPVSFDSLPELTKTWLKDAYSAYSGSLAFMHFTHATLLFVMILFHTSLPNWYWSVSALLFAFTTVLTAIERNRYKGVVDGITATYLGYVPAANEELMKKVRKSNGWDESGSDNDNDITKPSGILEKIRESGELEKKKK